MARILVVDDEQRMVELLKGYLTHRGHEVTGTTRGEEALAEIRARPYELVVTDLRMEPVDGMAVIDGVKNESPGTPVIVLTAYGEVKTAVEALRRGAHSYLTKPCNFEEVALIIQKALAEADLERQNRALQRTMASLTGQKELVGESPPMLALKEAIAKVAPSEATVLIRGESGTGKELVAHAIHDGSGRARGPFVAVNCAALPETLQESELFGYRKGAFTGADQDREGLFEAARGGTLFLDEIGEAGSAVQAKLLRVLEERKINRVGDPREREVDVRIVAATNRPLETAIAAGAFREDLYYRLLVFPLDVPPLRERLADIEPLARTILTGLGRRHQELPAVSLRRMQTYSWPGNVRELRNLLERAHILAGEDALRDEHVQLQAGAPLRISKTGGPSLPSTTPAGEEGPAQGQDGQAAGAELPGGADRGDLNLEDHQRRLILAALERASGNKSLAAKLLGITRRTLYSRLKLLGLQVDRD